MGGDDATNWNEAAYKSSILKSRESLSRTVFRAVFAPSPNPSPEKLVVASSDGSLASYSISKCISSSIVIGSEDGTARMWDCRTGKSIRVINARNIRT